MLAGRVARIALLTDFGVGPYVGQLRLLLGAEVPDCPVVDLIHDLPAFRPDLAAYLLPALLRDLPPACLHLCIVDPGVGGPREVLLVRAGGHWLMGPDNGLLALVARRATGGAVWRLDWRPPRMSASFHGRDLFVPLAVRALRGEALGAVARAPDALVGADWPDERSAIIYCDHYGNLMTGLRAEAVASGARIRAGGRLLARARTFCEVPPGEGFWYVNAFGLIELAVNQGSAARVLGLGPGDPVDLSTADPPAT
ncbi:SAM hydrolase/SAM-dependent halogenase family protein [Thiococcus pfennigii]|uniref:SAM hydrolase/SAM-dependent halogenase family protein n=1 Tax=Thiococcus pfennigii TaxID=1057 RepID=UPI001905F6D7|nr:SAM-dependent chlorinase/fluorinase [Thiococcus pfennigii]MBK1699916.1 hypothetical protein [Thiococcus pfennigii]MBK1731023.1 hypothetical protein [Thiococcus pfennigii]